jgi:hypothetical protein
MPNISTYEKLVVDLDERRIRILEGKDIESIITEIQGVINICQNIPIKDAQKKQNEI